LQKRDLRNYAALALELRAPLALMGLYQHYLDTVRPGRLRQQRMMLTNETNLPPCFPPDPLGPSGQQQLLLSDQDAANPGATAAGNSSGGGALAPARRMHDVIGAAQDAAVSVSPSMNWAPVGYMPFDRVLDRKPFQRLLPGSMTVDELKAKATAEAERGMGQGWDGKLGE
jgi:hypothetical protein